MDIITLDYESYWDQECSLSKLSPLEYINHPRFELQSVAVKFNDTYTDVLFGEAKIRHAFSRLDWSTKALLAHNNSGFDSYISAYRLGIKPKLWLDTMAMARPKHAKTTGLSLKALVEFYADELRAMGINPVKDNTVLVQTKGRRFEEFTEAEKAAMEVYNRDDTELCYGLFKILMRDFPQRELWQIDCLTRMRTEPGFVLDTPLLETALSVERDRKRKVFMSLAKRLRPEDVDPDNPDWDIDWGDDGGVLTFVKEQLSSSAKFSKLLDSLGREVPMKPSPSNPQHSIPALSKTDEAFIAMTEDEDELVAAAAQARLEVKSTLLETRIAKLLTAAGHAGGKLPVPLRYCGADTTGRDSGEEYNCQNLPAIRGAPKPSDAIRKSLRAPKGYKVGVADQSGIELRVNHFLWQVPSTMALYAEDPKADLYRAYAAERYGILPEDVDKSQRQLAKVAQLGLGFGAGGPTFRKVAKVMGGITLTDAEAVDVVVDWRGKYPEIVRGWRTCHEALSWIAAGQEYQVDDWGLVHTSKHGLHLPSGRIIRYPDLRQEAKEEDGRAEWVYAHGRHKARIYAGKVTENIVQALARDSIFDVALEFFRLTKLRPKLRVHDELVCLFPESEAEQLLELLQSLLRTPPKWWPELIVSSEGDIGQTYGDAK